MVRARFNYTKLIFLGITSAVVWDTWVIYPNFIPNIPSFPQLSQMQGMHTISSIMRNSRHSIRLRVINGELGDEAFRDENIAVT